MSDKPHQPECREIQAALKTDVCYCESYEVRLAVEAREAPLRRLAEKYKDELKRVNEQFHASDRDYLGQEIEIKQLKSYIKELWKLLPLHIRCQVLEKYQVIEDIKEIVNEQDKPSEE